MVAWPCGIGSVTGAPYLVRELPVWPIRLTVRTRPSQDAARRRLILKRAFGARASEARDGFDSYPLSLRERAGVRGVPKPLDK